MTYLTASGVISIIFGIVVLIAPLFLKDFCARVDRVLFTIDDLLSPLRELIGLALIAVAGALYYVQILYPSLKYLQVFWVVALVFGLLYLVFPNWLEALSAVANRTIFPTKEYVMGSCKLMGTIFILAGIYILIIVYLYGS